MKILFLVFAITFSSFCFPLEISYMNGSAHIIFDIVHYKVIQPSDLGATEIKQITVIKSYSTCRQLIYSFTAETDIGPINFDLSLNTGDMGLDAKHVNPQSLFNP